MGDEQNGAKWVGTNSRMPVARNTDRIPSYKGEHLWTWTALFRATPGSESPMLDNETLIQITGIDCLFCGAEYTKLLAGRFCRGGRRT